MSGFFTNFRNSHRVPGDPWLEILSTRAESRATRSGFVLLVTLVVLMVLATLGYNLASRVAAWRHRNSYIIDYASACYARDSAVKYALTTLKGLNNIALISRPNEPDFSDLFALNEPDYRRLMEQWAKGLYAGSTENVQTDSVKGTAGIEGDVNTRELPDFNEINDINVVEANEANAPGFVGIRGPYGPSWPLVTEPVELEIGSAKVKIGIEDENAKYPIGWAMLADENVQREAQAGLETFCEWMVLDVNRVDLLREQLKQVSSIKPFRVDFEPVEQKIPVTVPAAARRGRARPQRTVYKSKTISPAEQMTTQAKDFSKLLYSGLIDKEMLAAPTIISEDRKESALKYMGLSGATQVNINTAPRQVLEAAFTFGGDAEQIASEIIKKRREKPFASIEELKKDFFRFSDSIEKSKLYITAASNLFAIRITAVSGVAKATAVIIVLKEGDKIETIAIARG